MKADPNKPPYRVPSMPEIQAIPWNGFTVASTFSGAGGSCLGYRMAGFKVVWANEFVPIVQESYEANKAPGCILDKRDIHLVTAEEILKATNLRQGELDIFDGSPPCQAFSTAGKREKGWGHDRQYEHGVAQKNETLFDEYLRLLKGLRPKVFIAENVSGLVKGVAKGFFKDILKEMKASGYQVKAQLLDAQWLGVPQMRQRIIFIGVRNDLGIEPTFPKPLSYRYSVRDALPWITGAKTSAHGFTKGDELHPDKTAPTVPASASASAYTGHQVEGRAVHDTSGEYSQGDITERPAPSVTALGVGHLKVDKLPPSRLKAGAYAVQDVRPELPCPTVTCGSPGNDLAVPFPADGDTDISRYAIGREWDKLSPGEQSKKYFSLVKTDQEKPSPSIMASSGAFPSAAQPLHPTERRKFTIAELKRICAFPDDFVLKGSYAAQWGCLGNSVPPLMMRAIAEVVRDKILGPLAEKGRPVARGQ